MSTRGPSLSTHPHFTRFREERAVSLQNRVADSITRAAGSMGFVYLHIVLFGYWLITDGYPFDDPFPYGLLTMIVSLEAIFLSTFVMISQNRADLHREALANHEWDVVQQEELQNEELLTVSRQVLDLTQQVHALTTDLHRAMRSNEANP